MAKEKESIKLNLPDIKHGQTICWTVQIGAVKACRHGSVVKINLDQDIVKIEYERWESQEFGLDQRKMVSTWVSGKNVGVCPKLLETEEYFGFFG